MARAKAARANMNPGPPEESDALIESDEELSDADSDYLELQSDIAKFKESVRKFREEQRSNDIDDEFGFDVSESHERPHEREKARGNRKRGFPRGPRKAAEPTGDIRARMGKASEAFIQEDYEEARAIVYDAIRINAETFEAWTLLASIWKEFGDVHNALHALMVASHLRPKDPAQWMNAANFALNETGDERSKYLSCATFCLSAAIRANPKEDFEARYKKAEVFREMGATASAIKEYKQILKHRPHDTDVLKLTAESFLDLNDARSAQKLYKESIGFYMKIEDAHEQQFGWADLRVYTEIHAFAGEYREGIQEIKRVARWLLGRKSETYWDDITEDDREWDLEDQRRIQIPDFDATQSSLQQYGHGLPIDIRTKLGLFRIRLGYFDEGLMHLRWLDSKNLSNENLVLVYPELYRESADVLQEAGLFDEALVLYRVLASMPNLLDTSLHLQMGKCYLMGKYNTEAEECFQKVIDIDNANIEARIQLAKLYEELDLQEQAFIYVSEIMDLRRQQISKQNKPQTQDNTSTDKEVMMRARVGPKSYYKPKRLVDPAERQRQEASTAARLQEQYSMMRLQQRAMRSGDEVATTAWMEAASELIEDFRSFKTFYPWDKYIHFRGYTGGAGRGQSQTGATPLDDDLAKMADRISHRLGAEVDDRNKLAIEIPENYRAISFASWLDIFLEYAFCLVRSGRHREAYEICEAAKDAIVFYHSREDMFLIHICWCACAVLANDEETCVAACRYFMKDYQFTTDTYRMFAALTRLCQSPISWYSSGPTQKYMLRQIKAMDYGLVDDERRRKYFAEKGSYSAQDEAGRLIVNKDMDVALLMVYGHILYTGTSYAYALNYFFRAYALDPENPMITLSIGLGYVHYGLKRQAENRQFHIMQGLSFLMKYYQSRHSSPHAEERQEASYNIARAYHMLGLTHLALPYYMEVLDEAQDTTIQDELVIDAAYNLQAIYAIGGDLEMAQAVTNTYLNV